MQDEVVSRLANTLGGQLTAAEARRAERSTHPDAMDFVFQGKAWWNKGLTPEYMVQARSFFERAKELHPANIEAMVGLAMVDVAVGAALLADNWSERFSAAEVTLGKVLSLAPNHALAHLFLGLVQMFTKRVAQGIAIRARISAGSQLSCSSRAHWVRQASSWPRRRNRSTHQRGIPPFSSRPNPGSSMDGMGWHCQDAAQRRYRSSCLAAPGY